MRENKTSVARVLMVVFFTSLSMFHSCTRVRRMKNERRGIGYTTGWII